MDIKTSNLSFTAISKYLACPHEYWLYYKEKIRPVGINSALYFGKAVDVALTELLLNKNLNGALKKFNDVFIFDEEITFSEDDVDEELLSSQEEWEHPAYYSLKRKGQVMVESFYNEIMPRIKNVLSAQTSIVIANAQGDRLKIVPDMIVEWDNGQTILFDIKTSIYPYDDDSVKRSVQLALYHHVLEDKYNINSIGYIVLRKLLKKNRVKICEVCGFDGSGGRHSTCSNKKNGIRCEGKWNNTIKPEAYIQILIDKPNEQFTQMVMENIDRINSNINNNNFYQNLNACKRGKRYCDYYNLCHKNDMKGLVKKT